MIGNWLDSLYKFLYPRSYFQAVNNLRKLRAGDNTPPIQLADADGRIIPDIGWNLQKFGEYHSSIFYDSSMPCKPVHQPATGVRDDEPFSTEDVRAAIQKQKVGGAVGQDGISSEVLRAGSDILAGWLSSFFNVIRQLQHCSADLTTGIIVPIYKNGKPKGAPKSYRPVMLLSVVRKVLTTIITKRISTNIQQFVDESQAGFRPGRSTADGVFCVWSLCERALLGNWNYSAALLDFSGAFDTVNRGKALDRMADSGAPTSMMKLLVSDTTARVKIAGQLSAPFSTNIGVVQGDPMSPAMFIVYAEGAMRQVRAACTSPSCLPTHFSQYADDTTIHDTDRDAVVAAAAKCEPIFAQDDLRLNLTKTQFVTPSKDDDAWRKTKLLGSLLGSGSDIENRINAANRAFGTIAWKRHTLLSRMLMFTTLILPVLLYNCGLWTLTAALGNRLDTWHRRKLRSILGVVYPQKISVN